jgi:putative phosphoesterase
MADRLGTEATLKIGVISDTHGLMRPEALTALAGSDLIIHAGDVGSAAILEALRTIAPVVAVRGNNDSGIWAGKLAETEVIKAGTYNLYVLHNRNELNVDPVAEGFRIVVSGHSHQPSQEERAGILYLNPGSAGPRRFKLPIAVARLQLDRAGIRVEIVELLV